MSPRLVQVLRAVAQGALWFGAVNFGALVIAALALTVSGAVTPAHWRGAMRVLWGTSEAVTQQDLAALEAAADREKEREDRGTELDLVERWRNLDTEKERLDARAAGLRARLQELRSTVAGERDAVVRERERLEAESEKQEADRLRRRAELEAFASERIRRIYRFMRPAAVAADLQARMRKGQGEEAAAILKKLPERTVAEIFEAMADPATRNEIYDLMRTPVAQREEAQGGAK